MTSTKSVSVRVAMTPDQYAALQAEARVSDVSVAHVVRAAVRWYLGQEIGGTKK